MKTILIIEDNTKVRENVAEILELSSYKVLLAPEGKTGVETAIEQHPDLIICDIMMPVLDGYGVLHLLNKHPATYGIPFIFLTAKSEKEDFRKGMELGADDYITKPFDGIELLKAVELRLNKTAHLKDSGIASKEAVEQFIGAAVRSGGVRLVSEEREVYSYIKKQLLYTVGRRPHSVYYLVSGKIKIYKTNEDGKELITNICKAGDFLGYNAVVEEVDYRESAEVLEDAEVMLIPREDFMTLLTTDAQVTKRFISLITRSVMEKEEALLNMAYSTMRKKVAYGLMQALEKYRKDAGNQHILELSRENLAQVIGVATESLIRTLADFKSENLVDVRPGKIIILNEAGLRALPY